jgi:hypothetical protein
METDKEGASSKILGDLGSVIYSVLVFHIIVFVLLFRIDLVFVTCTFSFNAYFPLQVSLLERRVLNPGLLKVLAVQNNVFNFYMDQTCSQILIMRIFKCAAS